jgi:hypothetical protein
LTRLPAVRRPISIEASALPDLAKRMLVCSAANLQEVGWAYHGSKNKTKTHPEGMTEATILAPNSGRGRRFRYVSVVALL